MKKKILLTPGPTITPQNVQRAFFNHSLHHRTKEYRRVSEEAREKTKTLFGARNGEVLFYPAVGTPMIEAILSAYLARGKYVVAVENGFFGKKLAEMALEYGARIAEEKSEWGKTYSRDSLLTLVQRFKPRLVLMTKADTSTGILNNTNVGNAIKFYSPSTFFAVDAILEAGVSPIKMDWEGIDILIAAGQKSLLLPPGLGIIILSPRAVSWLKRTQKQYPAFFFDIRKELDAQRECNLRFTMPVNHIYALNMVLETVLADEAKWYRGFAERAEKIRYELGKLDFTLFTKDTPSNGVSVLNVPYPHKVEHIITLLETEGFIVAPGIGENHDTVIRLAHFEGTKPFIRQFLKTLRKIMEALTEARNND